MSTSWQVSGVYAGERWTVVQSPSVAPDGWLSDEVSRLEELWTGTDKDEAAREVTEILNDTAELLADPSMVLALVHWPMSVPVPCRVRVAVADADALGLEEWRGLGYEVDEYPGSSLGPGIHCHATRDEVVHGWPVHVSTSIFAFTNAIGSVMLIVESGVRDAYLATLLEIPRLLSGLAVSREDGEAFVANPVAGVSRNQADEWGSVSNA
ncbi:hypothetical protein ACFV9G_05080 [Nocardioides sp. NPDC059952]|uniref:hypothetical protein n=1 Tax=Nocardioides sp. NPDC059952 TaxID=3347014 RepID=UPI0036674850